jgi:hypothetical protein
MPTKTDTLDTLKRQHWTSVVGLLWGVVALALLTGWLYAFTHSWEGISPAVLMCGLLAVTLLALAGWQVRAGLTAGTEPGPAEAALRRQRRPAAFVLFVISAALVLLLIWLASQQGFAASFPELSSGLVLALVGIGAGILLLLEPGVSLSQERLLTGLAARRQVFLVLLGILGLGFLMLAIVLLFLLGLRPAFPEIVGCALVGLILLGGAVFLFGTAGAPLGAVEVRSLVLMVGGLIGLVIAFMAVVRALLWWNTVFAAGISAWRGDNAWRLWACFYAELLGLAILFGSLLLARADIRVNPTLRRLLFGYNTVLTGLLLLAVLVVGNVTVYACFPYTFEWTKTGGLYSLSEKSKSTLSALKEPVTIYVLMGQPDPDLRTLLQNIQSFTSKVQVEYISPDMQQLRFDELLKRYPKAKASEDKRGGGSRGLLVIYGPERAKGSPPPYAFIPSASLFDIDMSSQSREFKGEALLMTELRFLSRGGVRPTVYFLQGTGELDMLNNDPSKAQGCGQLVKYLRTLRYEVRGLVWGPQAGPKIATDLTAYSQKEPEGPHEIPKDALAVVIAQPQARYPKEAFDALAKYLAGKGKLVVLSRLNFDANTGTATETGLEDFLRKYGVELGRDYILHYSNNPNDLPFVNLALAPADSNNAIARTFERYPFLTILARTVQPQAGGAYRAETILEIRSPPNSSVFWAETDLTQLPDPAAYVGSLTLPQLMAKRSPTPLPVAAAVKDSKDNPKLVVFGDYLPASNLATRDTRIPYYALIDGSLQWLSGRPQDIGIGPRKTNFYNLPQEVSFRGLVLLPTGLILLGLLGFGAGVWVVRRR